VVRLPEYFRDDQFQLIFAADCAEALEILGREPAALVVVDLDVSPDESAEFLVQVHRCCQDAPCIVISGSEHSEDQQAQTKPGQAA